MFLYLMLQSFESKYHKWDGSKEYGVRYMHYSNTMVKENVDAQVISVNIEKSNTQSEGWCRNCVVVSGTTRNLNYHVTALIIK